MWAKTILNVENIVQMSDYIPNVGVISTVGKICLPLFTEKSGMQSRAAKLSIKRCIWLKLQAKDARFFFKSKVSSYYAIKGYDNTVPAGQVNKHNIIFNQLIQILWSFFIYAQENVILNYPALIQWPMGGIRCTIKDLSFGQRSVVSSETWQASKHSRNIYVVWTFWAM